MESERAPFSKPSSAARMPAARSVEPVRSRPRRALTTVAPNQMGGKTEAGLCVVPNLAVIPHYDKARFLMPIFGRVIRNSTPPDAEVIGIEEDTALVGRPGEEWTVHGRQSVVLLDRHKQRVGAGERLLFNP